MKSFSSGFLILFVFSGTDLEYLRQFIPAITLIFNGLKMGKVFKSST